MVAVWGWLVDWGPAVVLIALAVGVLVQWLVRKWVSGRGQQANMEARADLPSMPEIQAPMNLSVGLLAQTTVGAPDERIAQLKRFVSGPLYESHQWLLAVFRELVESGNVPQRVAFLGNEAIKWRLKEAWDKLDREADDDFRGSAAGAKLYIALYIGAQIDVYGYLFEIADEAGMILRATEAFDQWREKSDRAASEARHLSSLPDMKFMRDIGDLISGAPRPL